MTSFSIIGVLISIAAILLLRRELTTTSLLIVTLLLLLHVAASVGYYIYANHNLVDSSSYYFDKYHMATHSFALGSTGLTNFVQVLRTSGASYLDCFILFQSLGFCGLIVLAKTFKEIEAYTIVPDSRAYFGLLFLPTMNFWTAAIGKDAPLFFAISLCVWAMLSLRRRIVPFCVSMGIMILFRAHIAFMAATAIAIAAMFDSSISIGRKFGLLALAVIGLALSAGAVETTLGLSGTSVSAVSTFLNQKNAVYSNVGGTTSMGDAPLFVRLISLLFRPFFFDAHGLMGIVPSFENVGVIAAFLYMIVHWKDVIYLARRVFFIRFVLVYAFILLVSLTLVYYNVGLGLRERLMAYPMIFSILVALWSWRRKGAPRIAARTPLSLPTGTQGNRVVPEH